jgi:hypothetical protein
VNCSAIQVGWSCSLQPTVWASLGLPWWQRIIVRVLQEICIETEVAGSINTIVIAGIQLRPSDSLQNAQKTISDQNRFWYDSKAQGQTLKRVGIDPPSPVFHPRRGLCSTLLIDFIRRPRRCTCSRVTTTSRKR